MVDGSSAEVIEFPKKVKVLCFYELRRFGQQSLTSYWKGGQTVMIEVLSCRDIPQAFSDKMQSLVSKAEPWDRAKTTGWRLTAYLPETMTPTF